MRVGDIRQRLGETAEAEAALGRATELYQRLADDFPGTAGYKIAMAKARRALGALDG